MFDKSWKSLFILSMLPILAAFVFTSCKNTPTEDDKIRNADNEQLLKMLQEGNLTERRKVSAFLRNTVKEENIQALASVVSTEEDVIVVGNCAMALSKIGTKQAVKVLSETILSFTDFRTEVCGNALVRSTITADVISEIEKISTKKPEMLNVLVRNMNPTVNSNVQEFQLKLLNQYEKYPVSVISMIIERVGVSCEKKGLPKLFDIYYNSKHAELRSKAEQAITNYPEDSKQEIGEKYDKILKANAETRAEELKMKEIQKTRRLEKLKPTIPYDEMVRNVQYSALTVDNLELVKDYATKGHPGGFNGMVNEGELIAYNVHVKSSTELTLNNLSGYCYAYTDSVTVLNRRILFDRIASVSSQVSNNQLMILVSPDIKAGEKIELFFEFGESSADGGDLVFHSKAEIVVQPLPYGPFEFTVGGIDDDQWGLSEGNGNGVLEWGETCELLVKVLNKGEQDVEFGQLELVTLNQQSQLGKTRSDLGLVKANDEEGVAGVFDVRLSSEFSGRFSMMLMIKLNVIKDKKIIGTWTQKLEITVGEKKPVLKGAVKAYEKFDTDHLIDIFVIKQNNEDIQELFLFNTEVDYMDAKSLLILEDE